MNNTTLPFDHRLQSIFEEFQGNDTWAAKCVYRVYKAAQDGGLNTVVAGLIGQDGTPGVIRALNSSWTRADIWGINLSLCEEHCSRQKFPMVFNYQSFIARVTNYLLPWLALTAQLPYEAGDVVPNVLSFFVALGSPMLITFSLMMTILNKRWLNRKIRAFNQRYRDRTFATRLEGARTFLEAAQQVPIRVSRGNGWLASLILLGDNEDWWDRLAIDIRATRRGLTFSLVAQMSLAVTAWILTIIGSFGTSLGNHAESLVLSSSTLWTWLVPIILGWITVGTQGKAEGIQGALRANEVSLAKDPDNKDPASRRDHTTTGRQESFVVARRTDHDDRDLFNLSIYGDEIQPGPVYNYARVFTWRLTAQRLLHYFDTAADNFAARRGMEQVWQDHIRQHQVPTGPARARVPNPQPAPLTLQQLLADASVPRMEAYCGIPRDAELTEYPTATEVDSSLWFHVLGAFAMAAFVQWGTTGPAIVIAYLTEAKGLGCRSGSYLLYGVLSAVAFALFVASAAASRAALLRAQSGAAGGLTFRVLRATAVTARLAGRAVAVGNAVWIVLSSVWELVGFFDNCWCQGTQLSWGDKAWVALFKNTIELREYATASWAGGVFMSSFVMAAAYGVICLFCYDPGEA